MPIIYSWFVQETVWSLYRLSFTEVFLCAIPNTLTVKPTVEKALTPNTTLFLSIVCFWRVYNIISNCITDLISDFIVIYEIWIIYITPKLFLRHPTLKEYKHSYQNRWKSIFLSYFNYRFTIFPFLNNFRSTLLHNIKSLFHFSANLLSIQGIQKFFVISSRQV